MDEHIKNIISFYDYLLTPDKETLDLLLSDYIFKNIYNSNEPISGISTELICKYISNSTVVKYGQLFHLFFKDNIDTNDDISIINLYKNEIILLRSLHMYFLNWTWERLHKNILEKSNWLKRMFEHYRNINLKAESIVVLYDYQFLEMYLKCPVFERELILNDAFDQFSRKVKIEMTYSIKTLKSATVVSE